MGSINVSFEAEKYLREKAHREHCSITKAVDLLILAVKNNQEEEIEYVS